MSHRRRSGREFRRNQCLCLLSAGQFASPGSFLLVNDRVARVAVPPRSQLVFFQPFDKPKDISGIEITAEPGPLFLDVKSRWNINGVGTEIIKVPRDESELFVLFKSADRAFVVPTYP